MTSEEQNKVKRMKIKDAMRLDINYKKKTNTWRLKNTFLNNQQVTEEIKREVKKFLETNDNET